MKKILVCLLIAAMAVLPAALAAGSGSGESVPAQADEAMAVELLEEKPEDQLCIGLLPTETGGRMVYYVPDLALQQEMKEKILAIDAHKLKKLEGFPDWLKEAEEYNISVCYGDYTLNLRKGGAMDITRWSNYSSLEKWVARNEAMETYILNILKDKVGFVPFDSGRIKDIVKAELVTGPRYTGPEKEPVVLSDKEKLNQVEAMLSGSAVSFWPGCPFGNCRMIVTTASGDEFILNMAADSCTVFYADGIFFDYMPAEYRNTEDHPDNSILFDLFGVSPMDFSNV